MKICIIYHSETGNTRHVAQHLASASGAERLIEVLDRTHYHRLTRFLSRCSKAQSEETVPISPATIDVTPYDLIVFGSPVWAFKPTPVIHAAVEALTGCAGKPVIGFFTHGGRPGSSEETFSRWCEQRWLKVAGTIAIHMKEIENEKKTGELLSLIKGVRFS
jgi:flavodoxin